jgi:chromosome partitioning protein
MSLDPRFGKKVQEMEGVKENMRIITVFSQKGGSGKTTLAAHIAVQAELTGASPVGVLDADPQESLADWGNDRESDTPIVMQTSLWRLQEDVGLMRDRGMKLLLIDTPPGITPTIRSAIEVSDLVLVPVKPSPHDLRAAGNTFRVVEEIDRPLVFVINCASAWAHITPQAVIALAQHGTVAPAIIHQRADFASSMIHGRTVMELGRRSRSASEIAELWDYLNDRVNTRIHRTSFTPLKGVA